MRFPLAMLWALAFVMLAACAPAAPSRAPDSAGAQSAGASRPGAAKSLVFIARSELDNVTSAGGIGNAGGTMKRLFTATLGISDDQGTPLPYLAEALPQLNSDSWRVFPDGRMETTYRLRPNLAWHDGVPFTADDLVFSWRVYTTPELGVAGVAPQSLMEDVSAPDAQTFVIRWRRPFPLAGFLAEEFRPLPRHLLKSTYAQGQPDAWENQSYWTRDYIGLGPYRIERWEPGTAIEATAFDRFVLGRPKIERLRVIFITDPNTVLAVMLAGGAHLVADTTIRLQTAAVLRREWEGRGGGGAVIMTPAYVRFTFAQFRPDLVNPRGILDLRVRKAIAHAIDKQALNDGLFEGQGIVADTFATPRMPHYPAADRVIAKYPYDLRAAERYLTEAGYSRGADVMVAGPEGRINPEWRATSGGDSDTQLAILVDAVRRVGIDAHVYVLPQAIQDGQSRATFPGLFNWSTAGPADDWLTNYTAAKIPGPENRWAGNNRGGWSNPDYDRLADAYGTSLDRNERTQLTVDMLRMLSEELPVIPLYYNLDVVAHVSELNAPRLVAPDGSIAWNIQDWELR
jgi:peptide/nickel transport system substrate-binding protein